MRGLNGAIRIGAVIPAVAGILENIALKIEEPFKTAPDEKIE